MLFDSNILIRYLNGEPKIITQLQAWRQEGRAFIISSITTAEVLALKNLSRADINEIKRFLETFVLIPFDNTIAELAAECRRTYNLELPDAAIAATAMNLGTPLVTHDQQFKNIQKITVIDI